MSEKGAKKNLYSQLGDKIEFLRVHKKDSKDFDLKFPKKAFDKICKFYGNERLSPISFLSYHIESATSQITRLKTMSKEIEEGEADTILKTINEFLIIPKSLYSYDEEKQFELAIKTKGKYIQDIVKKAGFDLDSLLEFASIQIVEQEIQETTKIQTNYYTYETVFSLVPILKVIFENGDNFDIAFYSYRNILNKCGLKLEQIGPYLTIEKKDIDRKELMNKHIPLYESSKVRELKGKINEEIKDQTIYILKGGNVCKRYPEIPFDEFVKDQNEESILLHDTIDKINKVITNVKKKDPLSDIVQVKDAKGNNIFIYEDTLNKIEDNKDDPEKTTYKGSNPMKEEIICGKNPKKVSPNNYIKLIEPNIIVDKKDLENALKHYKPNKKTIEVKDIKGNTSEFDPFKINIYKASPEETEIIKILPADFSDINERLLTDIIPQNKLILSKDLNNKDILIKKKEGDNLIKYPKTDSNNISLYDKDGKLKKVSRKIIEKDNNEPKNEYIEIKDNGNNKNEIVNVNELVEALKDKENEDFEIKNKDGNKIKLKKKNLEIIKQDNKYIDIPEQGEEIKKKLLSDIKDSFIKVKDSQNNKETFLRNSQLNEVINYKPKAPFIHYELLNPKKEKVHITKEICKEKTANPNNQLILCYDEAQKEKSFLVPLSNIQNSNCDGDDPFDIGNGQKILFKNLRIKPLENAPEMGPQPEEEKMIKVNNLINKIKSGPLNKNCKINSNGNTVFIPNNYLNKLQNEFKNDEKDTKYKINDSFGKNKIILNKEIIDKGKKPGDYILLKNKNNNENYLVELNDLVNNLSSFKSNDDGINVTNSLDNKKMKLNPLNIEIVPPYNNFPIEKIMPKKIPKEKTEENDNKDNQNDKEKLIDNSNLGRLRLRSMPQLAHIPEKKTYKIRRAIIYKKQRKDSQ